MAKYIQTFENGNIKHELTFRGKTYDYTMEKTEYGRCADKVDFTTQLENDGFVLTDENGEELCIDAVCDDEYEAFYILELLDNIENSL